MFQRFIQPSYKLLQRIQQTIHHKFNDYPHATSAITGFVIFGSGEYITQRIMHEKNNDLLSFERVIQLGSLGFFMNGVFLTQWYRFLDQILGISMKCNKTVIYKCLADQLVYAPFSIVVFFGFTAMIKFNSYIEMKTFFLHKNEHSFWSTYMADCSIWPVANYINFRIIPFAYRPTWTAAVQFVWQIYLSYVSKEIIEEDEVKEGEEEVMKIASSGNGDLTLSTSTDAQ